MMDVNDPTVAELVGKLLRGEFLTFEEWNIAKSAYTPKNWLTIMDNIDAAYRTNKPP
jgi:hypothetical protein